MRRPTECGILWIGHRTHGRGGGAIIACLLTHALKPDRFLVHEPAGGDPPPMARSHARIQTAIWGDKDFKARSGPAQLAYFMLTSQPDLGHSGLLSLTVRRWAGLSADGTKESIWEAITELADSDFVVVDEDTEELLIRSLVRNDNAWKQPKVLSVAITEAARISSPKLRARFCDEMKRIDPGELPDKTREDVEALLKELPEALANAHLELPHEGPADPPPDPPAEDPANPPAEGGDEGDRGTRARGHVPLPLPLPHSPVPPPPPASAAAGARGGNQNPGEGESPDQDRTTNLTLVAEVRDLRPEWTTPSIVRALSDPEVLERPQHLVAPAMLAVARDPQSKFPGRLAKNGPWWHSGASSATPTPPPYKAPAAVERATEEGKASALQQFVKDADWYRRAAEKRPGGPPAPTDEGSATG